MSETFPEEKTPEDILKEQVARGQWLKNTTYEDVYTGPHGGPTAPAHIARYSEAEKSPESWAKRARAELEETFNKNKGCWWKFEGVIGFVDRGGVFYISPHTPEKEKLLKDAGYRESVLPLHIYDSEGHRFVNKDLQASWEKLKGEQ